MRRLFASSSSSSSAAAAAAAAASRPPASPASAPAPAEPQLLPTEGWLRELSADSLPQRLAALGRLQPLLREHQLEPGAPALLWPAVRDLLRPSQPPSVRQRVFALLHQLLSRLGPDDGPLRSHFFQVCVSVRLRLRLARLPGDLAGMGARLRNCLEPGRLKAAPEVDCDGLGKRWG